MIKLLFGTGVGEKQAEIAKLFAESLKKTPSLEKEVASEFSSSDELMAFLSNSSLFSEKRFVVLQGISANKEIASFTAENFDRFKALENIDIIFSETELDKRSVFYKTFASRKLATDFSISEFDIAKKLDLPTISIGETFSLTNHLLSGNREKYLDIINRTEKACFSNEDEGFKLFGLLTSQILQFLAVKTAGDKSLSEVAKNLELKSDYPLKQMASVGKNLNEQDALALVKLSGDLDRKIKTGGMTVWQAVRRLSTNP